MRFEYKTFLEYLGKETLSFQVYLNAAVVGSTVCFLTHHYTIVPFIVPLFVQVAVRSHVKFRQRHQKALVELPAQTEDPAFIMDLQGNIILSVGKTLDLFERFGIQNIKEFINEEMFDDIIEIAFSGDQADPAHNSVEAFSNCSLKWYDIKAKATGMQYGGSDQKILVWFQEITLRKIYHLRLRDLLRYSDSLITSLEETVKEDTVSEHLAAFLLKEYEAVYITRTDRDNNLKGYAFKLTPLEMIRSDAITIHYRSQAPINISRKKREVLSGDVSDYDSSAAFFMNNPFDPAVLEFIDSPVRNFITYNEADISIDAFNFRSGITDQERQFFEVVVNIYRTMVMLVDFKKELQRKESCRDRSE